MSKLTIEVFKAELTAIEREKIFYFIENSLSTYVENKDITNENIMHELIASALSNALDTEIKEVA